MTKSSKKEFLGFGAIVFIVWIGLSLIRQWHVSEGRTIAPVAVLDWPAKAIAKAFAH